MTNYVHVIIEYAQLDLLTSVGQEADGVEGELELGAGAKERATYGLGVAALPDELCRHNARRSVVGLFSAGRGEQTGGTVMINTTMELVLQQKLLRQFDTTCEL